MVKRICPFDDSNHTEKQQITSGSRTRKIRSSISEKTLQLLYKGANEYEESTKVTDKESCCIDFPTKKCWYCNKDLCTNCIKNCTSCHEDFCTNCSFHLYESATNKCYGCF